jgi:hypothetical protein
VKFRIISRLSGRFKMKEIKISFILFFIAFTVSCSIYDVRYDYDRQTDFAEFKTFGWMQVPEKAGISSLVVQRVKNAVKAELETKGLMMMSNNPDFLIAEHLGKKDKVQVTDWGYSYGTYGRYGRYSGIRGPGRISTYQYEEGILILDFVNAKSKKLIWRGAAKAKVQNVNTPEKSEKIINAAVKKILEKYPPSSSK